MEDPAQRFEPGYLAFFPFFNGGFFIRVCSSIFWFFWADFERLFCLLFWLPFLDLGVSRVNMADCEVERELFLIFFLMSFDIFFMFFKVLIPKLSCFFKFLISLYIWYRFSRPLRLDDVERMDFSTDLSVTWESSFRFRPFLATNCFACKSILFLGVSI